MDFDVAAVGLSVPPAAASFTTYRPAISVKNLGRYDAVARGSLSAYRAGLRVYFSPVLSPILHPGEAGLATAADDWLPAEQGDHSFFGNVTTNRDQNPKNDNLPPTTVTVGPPPPPPVPKTLDDIYDALQPLGTEATLTAIADSVPPAPATEPTLSKVRDQVTSGAKEATLLMVGDAIEDTAKEVTQLEVNAKLETRIPAALGPSGGLKVEPKVPTQFETLGYIVSSQTPMQLVFTLQTRVIFIQADFSNPSYILVGGEFMTPNGEHAIRKLAPGDAIAIEYNDKDNPLYICASIAPSYAIVAATTEP
jgi:hypothetical protein